MPASVPAEAASVPAEPMSILIERLRALPLEERILFEARTIWCDRF